MHSFLFVSRGRYTALTGFFMLCTLTVALALGTGIASAGPAGGHNQDVVSIKQALTMKDKSTTAINGTITKIMNGNRYMVSDHSGQAEVQIVPSVLGGQRLAAGDNVLLQVEIKKNKIEAKNVIKQQNLNQKHIPDPKHDPDPKHIPGPGANTGHSPISGPATNPGHSPNPVPGPVGGNIGHANDVVSIRQALGMKDKTNVAIRGSITKIMGGNKYTVADNSGSAEVQIGSKELNGQRLSVGDNVLLYGEVKKDKKQNIIKVKQVLKQQNSVPNRGHDHNPGHGR